MVHFGGLEVFGQIAQPDMSILIGQKLVENAIIGKPQMRHFR